MQMNRFNLVAIHKFNKNLFPRAPIKKDTPCDYCHRDDNINLLKVHLGNIIKLLEIQQDKN